MAILGEGRSWWDPSLLRCMGLHCWGGGGEFLCIGAHHVGPIVFYLLTGGCGSH